MQINQIIEQIKLTAIEIYALTHQASTEYSSHVNATGDNQLALDLRCDKLIEDNFSKLSCIKELISEEKDFPKLINQNAKYILAYDPLDGSSVIDVNFSVGSIFGIYEQKTQASHLKASVYTLYGPRLEIVIATDKVRLYRLDENGKFAFIKELNLEQKGKLNSPGGTQKHWPEKHKKMIDELFNEGYRLRYSGAMVADLHQILSKGGGLFSYPATQDKPNGKLRKLFEVFPFAFIFEKAGGMATNGKERILDLKASHTHDTSACFFGSTYEMKKVDAIYG